MHAVLSRTQSVHSFKFQIRNNFRMTKNNRKQIQHMAVDREDNVKIDIDRLVSSIEDMMPHDLLVRHKCCIFKTPAILYRHNEKAFIPDAFSVGPLHHGRPNVRATEKIKVEYLQSIVSRSLFPDTMLTTLITSIMKVEKEARECYAEVIDYSPEELVKILVVDGCFLIEFFLRHTFEELRKEDDPIFTISCMIQFLGHDLILLENQVPWMVLEILFDLTKDSNRDMPLCLLVANFFHYHFLSYRILPPPQVQMINLKDIKHFVDLFRKLSTLSSVEEKKERTQGWELLPSATRLVKAGIKFKRGTSACILDIKFIDGVLEIPPIVIHDITETVFRNLISYEQCHPKCEARVTSYAMFLDNLIITTKDMDILCDNQIIVNWLNHEDAAQIFNQLYHDTYVKDYYYQNICHDVNRFCQRRWPRWRAVLVRNYFDSPWAILSTLATFIVLIPALLQTCELFM